MGTETKLQVQTFARNLERYLETPIPEGLNPEARFEDLPGWTSLLALLVAVGLESDYGVTISENEFREAHTVEDLYRIVVRRMAA